MGRFTHFKGHSFRISEGLSGLLLALVASLPHMAALKVKSTGGHSRSTDRLGEGHSPVGRFTHFKGHSFRSGEGLLAVGEGWLAFLKRRERPGGSRSTKTGSNTAASESRTTQNGRMQKHGGQRRHEAGISASDPTLTQHRFQVWGTLTDLAS